MVVHGETSAPPRETPKAALAFSTGSYRSVPRRFGCAAALICQRPRESSPLGLCAPLLPPDSASAIAVIVADWSGLNPAIRAKR